MPLNRGKDTQGFFLTEGVSINSRGQHPPLATPVSTYEGR
jgi:hypothetical protein